MDASALSEDWPALLVLPVVLAFVLGAAAIAMMMLEPPSVVGRMERARADLRTLYLLAILACGVVFAAMMDLI